jgi:NAD-dependent dihydropyrimidine dehydrogenase PreA subunit
MTDSPSLSSIATEHIHLARTLRHLKIHFNAERCKGVWQCYEVCPIGCWAPDREQRVVVHQHTERCIACGACVLQCPEKAIELRVPDA